MSEHIIYYTEYKLNEKGQYLRMFDPNLPPIWHKDLEDREIYTTLPTNWKFQFDNQLPMNILPYTKINIPKLIFHRLISDGITNLYLYLTKKEPVTPLHII